jgi:curved DNA-binding protein CbpA
MDYYRLLRIEPQVPLSEIRSAYHRARRQFHPDAHLDSEEPLRDAVDRIARRITEAYLTLRDSRRRTLYDQGLAEGSLRYRPEATESSREPRASRSGNPHCERFFNLALAEQREGNLATALSHVKMALTFDRDNAGIRSKLEELNARLKESSKPASSAKR